MPIFRLFSSWGYLLVVAIAFYIVWTVISGFVGTFYRFFRFWAKLAPVIGLIGWVMSQSGHGSLPEVMELVKQWTGIGQANGAGAGGAQAPGIAQLAGMFGLGQDSTAGKRSTKRTTRSSTRQKKGQADTGAGVGLGDLADILKSATGNNAAGDLGGGVEEGGLQDIVQGFVKNAVLKASGLDWLFGQTEPEQKKRTR